MGLVDLFRDENRDLELCKLRDLIIMSYLDGQFTENEMSFILDLMLKEGIDIKNLSTAILQSDSIIDVYPESQEDKIEYLTHLVMLMMIDGECSPEEIKFCECIASRLGFSADAVSTIFAALARMVDSKDRNKAAELILSYVSNLDE